MKKKDRALSAAELMKKLEADSDYRTRRAKREEEFRRRAEMDAALDKPIIEALAALGFRINSVDGIVREMAPLPKAVVDVLLQSLEHCQDSRHCETLVRALGAAKEPFDGRILASLYDRTWDCALQFAIANTIALAKPYSIQHWIEKSDKHSSLRVDLTNLGYFA